MTCVIEHSDGFAFESDMDSLWPTPLNKFFHFWRCPVSLSSLFDVWRAKSHTTRQEISKDSEPNFFFNSILFFFSFDPARAKDSKQHSQAHHVKIHNTNKMEEFIQGGDSRKTRPFQLSFKLTFTQLLNLPSYTDCMLHLTSPMICSMHFALQMPVQYFYGWPGKAACKVRWQKRSTAEARWWNILNAHQPQVST